MPKREIKPLFISVLFSYVAIFVVILIKTVIVGDTLKDVADLAKELSLISTIGYGLFCLFQEIIFRGILQRVLVKKTKNIIYIFAFVLFFSVF